MESKITPIHIAEITHTLLNNYKEHTNQENTIEWEKAPSRIKEDSINGVLYHLKNPDASDEDTHNKWMEEKISNGWKYGNELNENNKEHPHLVSYDKLPDNIKLLDHLFKSTVNTLKKFLYSPDIVYGNKTTISKETEITIFGRIVNMEDLNEFTEKEHHVQLESKLEKGKCRVRKTTTNIGTTYQYVLKIPVITTSEDLNIIASNEYKLDVDELFFNGFKEVANCCFYKTRYIAKSNEVILKIKIDDEQEDIIKLPDIKYEVDIYDDINGQPSEWCKIDIEVDTLLKYINERFPDNDNDLYFKVSLQNLPINLENVIVKEFANDEQLAIINNLFNSVYKKDVTENG